MADTGLTYVGSGTNVDRDGSPDWTGTSNITQSSGYAICTIYNEYSDWLKGDSLGFSIPAGATINGIQVAINRYTVSSDECKDSSLRLHNGSAFKGDDKADTSTWYPTTAATKYYGGATDLWGTTWTANEINNIGIYLSSNNPTGYDNEPMIYYIKVRVWYTMPFLIDVHDCDSIKESLI